MQFLESNINLCKYNSWKINFKRKEKGEGRVSIFNRTFNKCEGETWGTSVFVTDKDMG